MTAIPAWARPVKADFTDREGRARTAVIVEPTLHPLTGRLTGKLTTSLPAMRNIVHIDCHVESVTLGVFDGDVAAMARVNRAFAPAARDALPLPFDPEAERQLAEAEQVAADAGEFEPGRNARVYGPHLNGAVVEVVRVVGALVQVKLNDAPVMLQRDELRWEWL